MTLQPNPERAAKGMWWDRAWSLVDGCTPVSAGCDHCWSRAMAARFGRKSAEVRFREDRLGLPAKTRKPTVWALWNDLFHEAVKDWDIAAACHQMNAAGRHLFIVLSKRPERMAEWSSIHLPDGWPPNVILGTSVEDQATADKRIPELLKVRAACRCVSYEPALGPVDFSPWISQLGWVIGGGETGRGARPCDARWLWSVAGQCEASGVPFWFKSFGKNQVSLGLVSGTVRQALAYSRRQFPEVSP